VEEPLERAAEEIAHIPLDLGPREFPAGRGEVFVFIGQHFGQDAREWLHL